MGTIDMKEGVGVGAPGVGVGVGFNMSIVGVGVLPPGKVGRGMKAPGPSEKVGSWKAKRLTPKNWEARRVMTRMHKRMMMPIRAEVRRLLAMPIFSLSPADVKNSYPPQMSMKKKMTAPRVSAMERIAWRKLETVGPILSTPS
ncbi:hypothetical protein A2634_01100 [Candidatus Amesbacteria bacterium RIFCSPHIGHO2_01_FULL_48_32]|uniref:Uncharacterized protein n=1 Tax=Candidatus Amesbacteria bacterium RIFCSPLOWO2_01_FULL_48_25 TaxID=1797259 RepID=A0A1F4ZBR5_9BACT|nr:MAG: hypothetical protein A2634_01100 [Candidatus Amesbacteria bacterium RIFCSPHIGHO2_01_FULL_48_32]OGD03638.1 MAG: hypothetical protein A2989_03085 [Candidatus Amesbacteria bacterium RIFCSPLOWO2_01_FULL_48_25]